MQVVFGGLAEDADEEQVCHQLEKVLETMGVQGERSAFSHTATRRRSELSSSYVIIGFYKKGKAIEATGATERRCGKQ